MVSIATGTVSDEFGVDVGSACLCVFEFFQDKHACAFRQEETVSSLVEGSRCVLGVVVTFGQASDLTETRQAHWAECSFGTTGDCDIGFIATDEFARLSDSVCSRGACGYHREVWSLESPDN